MQRSESTFFFFAVHSFLHFFLFLSTLHDFSAFLRSFFLHFVSSATQSLSGSGGGEGGGGDGDGESGGGHCGEAEEQKREGA